MGLVDFRLSLLKEIGGKNVEHCFQRMNGSCGIVSICLRRSEISPCPLIHYILRDRIFALYDLILKKRFTYVYRQNRIIH